MSKPVDVYLPCQVFPVLARYGQLDDLSTLEFLILRAVKEGAHNIDTLKFMFGVNERMMLEALRGLWSLEHLIFDFAANQVFLSEQAKELFKEKKFEKLALATAEFVQCELMFDLVSGYVLPLDGEVAPPNSSAIIPYNPGAVALERVTNDSVFAALNDDESGRPFRERGMKLWEASISFRQDYQAPQIRFKRIKVAARYNNPLFDVVVLDRDGLRFSLRKNLSRYLTRIVNEGKDQNFVEKVRNSVSPDEAPFQEVGNLLGRLLNDTVAARSCPAGEVRKRHQDMVSVARAIEDGIKEEVMGQAQIDPIVGRAAHEKLVAEMLVKAKEQVVIAAPSLSTEGLFRLRIPIRQALGNNKRVIILWGLKRRAMSDGHRQGSQRTTPYDLLEQGVKNLITEFRTKDGFYFSEKASGTRANFIVCDNNKVLLTSLNIFDHRDSGTEVGVLLQSSGQSKTEENKKREDEAPTLPLAVDVLTWACEMLPDRYLVDAIRVWPKEFPGTTSADLPQRPKAPPELSDDNQKEMTNAKINVWGGEWHDYVRKTQQLCRRLPSARLIRDGEHRQLLEQALTTATKRLIITSDFVSDKAINPTFLERLADRIALPIPVRLVYRQPSSRGANSSTAERTLHNLARGSETPQADVQCVQEKNNAKVLIHDDLAVVSCYSFLSDPGQFIRDRGLRSTDLGLLVTGPGIADVFANAITRAFPALREVPSTQVPEAATVAKDPYLALVVKRLSEKDSDGSLIQLFANSSDPWRLLEEVVELSLATPQVRIVVAACLAATGREFDAARYDHWLRFLARDALLRSDLIEASLLLGALNGAPESSKFPSRELVEIAATLEQAPISGRLLNLDAEKLQMQYQRVIVLLEIAETLRSGSRATAEMAYLLAENCLPPVWREAIEAVLSYLEESYEQPFAHSLLSSDRHRREEGEKFQEAFRKLFKALREFSKKQIRAGDESKTRDYLFQRSGLFATLLQIAESRDIENLHNWLDNLGDRDARNVLLEATKSAVGGDEFSIAFFKKKAALETMISHILQAAHKLGRETRETQAKDAEKLVAAARSLSATLARLWPRLNESAVASLDELSLPLASTALKAIERVASYG